MDTKSTQFLALFGWPVAHSRSPQMQNAALLAWGKNVIYGAFPILPSQLSGAIASASSMGFLGLNITLPHKEAVLPLCKPDTLAVRSGAVNTLRFKQGNIQGTNTDIYGFNQFCTEAGIALDSKQQVIVLGAGGASRAVLLTLLDSGAHFQVFSRTPKTLFIDGRNISSLPLVKEILTPSLVHCDLLIDCTPRGLIAAELINIEQIFAQYYPELDLHLLPKSAKILDLATRSTTLLTERASYYGLQAFSGQEMLIHQGARALEYWFQEALPPSILEQMRAAID